RGEAPAPPGDHTPRSTVALSGHVVSGSPAHLLLGAQAAAATTVELDQLDASGRLVAAGVADVGVDGSFTVEAPAGATRLIASAIAADGSVVARGLIDATGAAGASVAIAPLDAETTVEAEVFLSMIDLGVSLEAANTVDVRGRVTAGVAAALVAAAEAGIDVQAELTALAQGIALAQAVEVGIYAQAGIAITQEAMFEATVAAAAQLSADLAAGADAATATAAFQAEVSAAIG